MRNCFICLMALFIYVLSANTMIAYGQKKNGEPASVEIPGEALMSKLAGTLVAPEESRILSAIKGNWYYDLKYWTSKDAEPQLSSGLMTNEMIFDNRFLSSKTNVGINVEGQTVLYKGEYIIGYNPAKKAFASVLWDNLHAGLTVGEGTYDEKNKTLTEIGFFTHPLTRKLTPYKSVLELGDDQTHTRTIFIKDGSGAEFKAMEIIFQRPN